MRLERIHPARGRFQVNDSFWSPRLERLFRVTLKDTLDKLERDGAVENYRDLASGRLGGHRGMPWYDGLLLENICCASDYLSREPDPALETRLDDIIEAIEAAQLASDGGCLFTYTQLDRPAMRYGMDGGNILWQHDLYNNGCLFEAGTHHYRATGKTALLACAVRCANALSLEIGKPPKAWIVVGHPLPEYALMEPIELFEEHDELQDTLGLPMDSDGWRTLADFWVRSRGRHEHRTNHPRYMGEYAQDHAPIHHQVQAAGHAVCAMLYYTGVTRLTMVEEDGELLADSVRLWENATGCSHHSMIRSCLLREHSLCSKIGIGRSPPYLWKVLRIMPCDNPGITIIVMYVVDLLLSKHIDGSTAPI